MKTFFTPLTLIAFLIGYCNIAYSQKDTLHIYYKGLQTNVADSNDAKITKWAKTLAGKHSDVEILAYYESSDLKKNSAERAENLWIVINRKARDYVTIKSFGPVKGKKSQRSVVDIVYTTDGSSTETNPARTNTQEDGTVTDSGDKKPEQVEKKESSKKTGESATKNESSDKKVSSGKKEEKYEYIMDSVYVNGVLKVTKRKVKKYN